MTRPVPEVAGATRRRTHPLTPLVSSVRPLGLAGFFVLFYAGVPSQWSVLLLGLLGALLLAGLIVGYNYLAWTRTEFFFDEAGDFRLDSGVLQRNERRIALSRLQSVDVVKPLLGRVVGLAQVRIEVAGTGDSRVLVSYLTEAEAHALRAEIIARAAGVDPRAGEAPEVVLATVPTNDLGLSLLLRSETIMLALATAAFVAVAFASEGASGLVLLLITGGVPLLGVFSQFNRNFGFTVADSPDGLRLRHGLTNVQSQTVPPGRVQALEISQPLLWRSRNWVRVTLNVAGVVAGEEQDRAEMVLLPVAPAEVAGQIIARVLPGVDIAGLAFTAAPDRARRRAWLQFANLGVAVDDRVLAARRGFLTQRIAVIPHVRTQSVGLSQGPWERALGLASVQVDSTPGPVSVIALHRDLREARELTEQQVLRAARARAGGPADRWMTPRPPGAADARPPGQDGPRPAANLPEGPAATP